MTSLSDDRRALEATALWGGCTEAPRLVARRENAVYDVRLPQCRAALRLHRPGNVDLAEIEAELFWVEQLADAGVACPRPVRSLGGRLCEMVAGRPVSVVRWIDATPLSSESGPGNLDETRRLGRCLAECHAAADRLALCPVPRRTWKIDDLLGPSPRWGSFWQNPALTASERSFLMEARDVALGRLRTLKHPDVGLIHADTLRENVLDDGTRLWLIDFDDAGWGYRGYDLGTALVQQVALPGLADRIAALSEGYAEHRPDIGPRLAPQIPLFMLVRGLATAGWIVPRVATGDPRLRHYAERALETARAFAAA